MSGTLIHSGTYGKRGLHELIQQNVYNKFYPARDQCPEVSAIFSNFARIAEL